MIPNSLYDSQAFENLNNSKDSKNSSGAKNARDSKDPKDVEDFKYSEDTDVSRTFLGFQ